MAQIKTKFITDAAVTGAKIASSTITNANISGSAAIAYSKLNLSASIVNADVASGAAIAYAKLNLSASIVDADVASGAAIAYAKLALSASIVNADIAAAAAIDYSKLAALTASRALVSDGSGFVSASSVTSTELGYVSGVTSSIQTQLNGKALDADVIKKDGSVAFTGAQSMGGFKLTNLAAPTANGDALRFDQLGANSGIATLDGGGKIPVSQLPSSVMTYEGTWNANTNSPTLADGTGDAGMVYLVSVAGSQNLGSGSITFAVGDWVVYNGSIWEKSTNSNAVVSVNSQTGVVVLDTDDISEGTAKYFTDERAQDAVGSILLDTSSIDFTYDDGTPNISAVVLPGGVDHDLLLNFVANEHIDHSAVSINTAALSGLSGGGDITASRSLVADPNNATAVTAASGDFILVADISDSNALKKVTAQSIADLASASSSLEEQFSLSAGDITNQYIDLSFAAVGSSAAVNSVSLFVIGGPLQQKTVDYTVSLAGGAGGVTRLSFAGDLATGGAAALVAADILVVQYSH